MSGWPCYLLIVVNVPLPRPEMAVVDMSDFYRTLEMLLTSCAEMLVRHTLTTVLLMSALWCWQCLTTVAANSTFPSPGTCSAILLDAAVRSSLQRLV